jgi:hypothetical protein
MAFANNSGVSNTKGSSVVGVVATGIAVGVSEAVAGVDVDDCVAGCDSGLCDAWSLFSAMKNSFVWRQYMVRHGSCEVYKSESF